MTAGSLAGVIGNPLSGLLLKLDGIGGLHGWQWLFLVEGIPAVLLGLTVLVLLTERPADASWLTPGEKAWLESELEQERTLKEVGPPPSLWKSLTEPRVFLLALVYFLIVVSAYGFEMWLPVIVKPMAGSDFRATLYSAIPYIIATVVMVAVGIVSDKVGERRWVVALCAFASAIGFFASTKLQSPVLVLAALSLAWCGIKSAQGPFWALSASTLSGSAVAGGLALINSIANLGGQIGPWAVGWLVKKTGSFSTGLFVSAFLLLGAGLVVLCLRPRVTSGTPPTPT
jgi:ACS family tartrate transporter-like MFS transporter